MDQKEIEIGVGATKSVGSDRYPYTVAEIVSPKKIKVQADSYRRTDSNGFSESQTYEFSPNPDARIVVLTLRKNGQWVEQGESMNGSRYYIGTRNAYQDPSF